MQPGILVGVVAEAASPQPKEMWPEPTPVADDAASFDAGTTSPLGAQDCSTDLECLIDASRYCDPALVLWQSTTSVFGMRPKPTALLQLDNPGFGQCSLYVKIQKVDLRFSDELIHLSLAGGASEEEFAQAEQLAHAQARSFFEGLDGTCRHSAPSDLVVVLQRWQAGSFSTTALQVGECAGPLFGAAAGG